MSAAAATGIRLKLAGTGPLLDTVMEYSRKYCNIEYEGILNDEKLSKIISNCYFVMVPSEWYENNPMTIVESYALSKPVIGSQIGGIPEVIIQGKTGYLFESRNINNLIQLFQMTLNLSEESYLQMCFAAREFSEKYFSSKDHYGKLMQLYSQIINNVKGNQFKNNK